MRKVSRLIFLFLVSFMIVVLIGNIEWPGKVHAVPDGVITLGPSAVDAMVGENISIAVTVINVTDLSSYQVAIKYNGTLLNLTAAYYPDNFIFAGQPCLIPVEPVNGSTIDGFNYVFHGAALLYGSVNVNSTPTALFVMNFTVADVGYSLLHIGTSADPSLRWNFSWDTVDTLLLDSNLADIPFSTVDGAVSSVIPEFSTMPILVALLAAYAVAVALSRRVHMRPHGSG